MVLSFFMIHFKFAHCYEQKILEVLFLFYNRSSYLTTVFISIKTDQKY